MCDGDTRLCRTRLVRSYAIPSATVVRKVTVPDEDVESLFGSYDENLKHLETAVRRPHPHQRPRAASSKAKPADVARAERVLDQLAGLMRGGYKLAKGDVRTASQLVAQDETVELADYFLRGADPDARASVR